jgi:hypothetical protein
MRRLHADRGENNAPGMGSEPLQAAALRVDSSARNKRTTPSSSASSFFSGARPTPGTIPAISQLVRLISIAAIRVLS